MLKNIKTLSNSLSHKRKLQGTSLLFLMILTALLEIISIGAVIPFISALTQPKVIMDIPLVENINNILGLLQAMSLLFYDSYFLYS